MKLMILSNLSWQNYLIVGEKKRNISLILASVTSPIIKRRLIAKERWHWLVESWRVRVSVRERRVREESERVFHHHDKSW